MNSFILHNATVIDGVGSPRFTGGIVVENGIITQVFTEEAAPALPHTALNAHGLVLAPGFIDPQNHSDSYWQIFDNPSLDSMVAQGYTTLSIGHCGGSLAPLLSITGLESLQKWHDMRGMNVNWRSFAEFLAEMQARNFGANIVSFVGYSTVRRGLVGHMSGVLSSSDIRAMKRSLELALDEGARGVSVGLAYGHESNASEIELYEMSQLVAAKSGVLSVHLRNEGQYIIDSLEEALQLAELSGVQLKISHLKMLQDDAAIHQGVMQLLDRMHEQRLNVHVDVYPYDSIWQPLTAYLPKWAVVGGRQQLIEMLHYKHTRRKLKDYLRSQYPRLEELVIASTAITLNSIGKSIGHLAKDLGVEASEAVLTMVEHGGAEVLVFDHRLNQTTVEQLLAHPLTIIGSDGAGYNFTAQARFMHPRCFGTAPQFLTWVREKQLISLEEAVAKLTSRPAISAGVKNRGAVQTGNFADLVLFDPAKVGSTADLENPMQHSSGIHAVWVNGALAWVEKGASHLVGIHPGQENTVLQLSGKFL